MKATVAPAIEHSSSSQALHDQNKGKSAFFGPAAENETPFSAPRIQTKLTIGRPGDKYEQEADSVADRVVQRLSNPQTAAPALQRKCTDCEEKEKLQRKEEEEPEAPEVMRKEEAPPVQAKEKEEEEKPGLMRQAKPDEKPLQAKAAPDGAAAPSPSLENRLSSAKGSGAQMDKSTRQPLETAFGQDFSRVRIHTDSGAAQMNRELNARAFTHGRDIYLNAGEYSPGSPEGRRLLAHELVHVGQQTNLASGGFLLQRWETEGDMLQRQININNNIFLARGKSGLVIQWANARYAHPIISISYRHAIPWVFCPNPKHKYAYSKNDILSFAKNKSKKGWIKGYLYAHMPMIGKNLEQFPSNEYVTWLGSKISKCNLWVGHILYLAGLNILQSNGLYPGADWYYPQNKVAGLKTIQFNDVRPGDIFAKGGHHVGIIYDVGINGKFQGMEYWSGISFCSHNNSSLYKYYRI